MKCVLLFLSFFIAQSVFSQTITATSSATDVFAMQAFEVTYKIEGVSNAQLVPPDFAPFRISSGPFQSSNISIINGKRSESISYTYRLIIDKPGKYTIGKATMKTGSYSKKSNTLEINVLKPSKENAAMGSNLFLEMEISDSTIYVGQQFQIDHTLFYGNVGVRGSALVGDFPLDRFLVDYRDLGSRIRKTQIMRDGKMQNKAPISRLSIFPLRSGPMEIPDINFQIDVENPNAPKRGFFGFNRYDRKVVQTPAFTVDVLPLPDGAPEEFTGCVGSLNVISNLSQGPYNVGSEIFMKLELRGTGIKDQVNIPTWEQEGFEIYEPKLVDEKSVYQNGEIVFTKTYEYLVIPQEAGKKRVEIPYAYFDPTTGKYVQKKSTSTMITINSDGNDLADATAKTLDENTAFTDKKWYEHLWLWGLLCLVFAGLIYYIVRKNSAEKEPELTVEEAALIVAKRKLSSANELLQSGNTGKYWETLENSLRIYLEEKLGIGTTDYSVQEISDRWTSAKMNPELLETWKGMVDKINRARYAGQSISDMENLYKEALDWIVEVEKEA